MTPAHRKYQPLTSFPSTLTEESIKAIEMTNHVMKTLIVDDEPIARRVLREELELFPEVEIVEPPIGREWLVHRSPPNKINAPDCHRLQFSRPSSLRQE